MGHSRSLILFALALAVVLGCGKHMPRSGAAQGTEVGVWVYERFPPEGGESPVRFRLSPAELARVSAYIPDASQAEDHRCKCGVPRFGVQLYERGAAKPFAEGDFFHGPDQLVLTFSGGSARITGQTAFHDALVAVIQARGNWK
jgi:hypothetical protein